MVGLVIENGKKFDYIWAHRKNTRAGPADGNEN